MHSRPPLQAWSAHRKNSVLSILKDLASASSGPARLLVASIEGASDAIIPQAEKIIATTEERAHAASALLSSSQLRTRQLIAVVGVISVVLGLFVSFSITRGITQRLAALGAAMKQL